MVIVYINQPTVGDFVWRFLIVERYKRQLPHIASLHPRIGFLEGMTLFQRSNDFNRFAPNSVTFYRLPALPFGILGDLLKEKKSKEIIKKSKVMKGTLWCGRAPKIFPKNAAI